MILSTRHSFGKLSNSLNEQILIYDLDVNSIEANDDYTYAFKGGFASAADYAFGSQISVSENTLAIAAQGSSSNAWGDKTGSVYIFEKLNGTWNFQDEIIAPEAVKSDGFAKVIEIYEDLLFVGAPNYDSIIDGKAFNSTGKVYIYKKKAGNWEYITDLVSPIMGDSDGQGYFGKNITYYKGHLAISEIWKNKLSSEAAGRVYLYQYNESNEEFSLQIQFENNENYNFDDFGSEVIINDKYMVIGTGGMLNNTFKDYKVYVYKMNSAKWLNGLPEFRFASSSNLIFSRYGRGIALKGDLLLVGDPTYKNTDDYSNLTGQIYGFKIPENAINDQVIYESFYINPSLEEDFSLFGRYLSVYGNDLYISAQNLTNPSYSQDLMYKFDLRNINENENLYGDDMTIIAHPEGMQNTGFGSSVEVGDGFLLVGSPEEDTKSGFKSGAVYAWELQFIPDLPIQPSIDSIPDFCNNMAAYELNATPQGGIWKLNQVELENNLLNISALAPGEHTISYTLNGLTEESTFIVYANTEIESKSAYIITKCTNDEINLFIEVNNNQNMFNWYYKKEAEDNYLLLDSAMDLTSIKITESGFYQVSLVNSQCSEVEEEFQVINYEIFPELNLNNRQEFCESEISLAVENIESYEELTWYYMAENSTSFMPLEDVEDHINITTSGDYFCAIKNLSCEFITDTVSVLFKSNAKDLFIPNVATVNNDGVNDSFRIKTDATLKDFNILIYNRYGKTIYQSKDQYFQWYAEKAHAGTFFYKVEYETECGDIEQRNGWVQMIK